MGMSAGYRQWCNHSRAFLGLSSECGEAGFHVRVDPASCIFRVPLLERRPPLAGVFIRVCVRSWVDGQPRCCLRTVARLTDTGDTGTPFVISSGYGPVRLPRNGRRRQPRSAFGPPPPAIPTGRRHRHREPGRADRAESAGTARTGSKRNAPRVCAGRRSKRTVARDTDTGARLATGATAARAPSRDSVRKSRRGTDAIRGRGRDFRTVHIRRASRACAPAPETPSISPICSQVAPRARARRTASTWASSAMWRAVTDRRTTS